MFPVLHTMNGAVIDGDVYIAITEFGLSSIICHTDIHEGEETWNMMFDGRHAGRIYGRQDPAGISIAPKLPGCDPVFPTAEQVHEAADMVRAA